MALRIAIGLAGLAFCSIGVGILINLEAASGAEGELKRLFQPLPLEQMAWWAAMSVLLGFAALTNATRWMMRHRVFAYVQAGFFLLATAMIVALCVRSIVDLGNGVGTLGKAMLYAMAAAVSLLCLLRAVGIAWRWTELRVES